MRGNGNNEDNNKPPQVVSYTLHLNKNYENDLDKKDKNEFISGGDMHWLF